MSFDLINTDGGTIGYGLRIESDDAANLSRNIHMGIAELFQGIGVLLNGEKITIDTMRISQCEGARMLDLGADCDDVTINNLSFFSSGDTGAWDLVRASGVGRIHIGSWAADVATTGNALEAVDGNRVMIDYMGRPGGNGALWVNSPPCYIGQWGVKNGPDSPIEGTYRGADDTVDAVELYIWGGNVAAGRMATIMAEVSATDGTDHAEWILRQTVWSDGFGGVTTEAVLGVYRVIDEYRSAGAATWDAKLKITSNRERVAVTGQTGKAIRWTYSVSVTHERKE
jgi:hypothetical protein